MFESFHQQEELTTRLHNILGEYPPGIGPFQEFLQNADDAGARHFKLVYDRCSHTLDQLAGAGLDQFQGPALYVYNDATFTERDFESISSLGRSRKREEATAIGKYGLGFNTAYHFTDVVSFISGDQLVIFDPHGRALDGQLGVRCQFTNPAPWQKCAGTIAPFREIVNLGDDAEPRGLEGTLFRLPLRNAAQASASLISEASYDHDTVITLLQQFGTAANEMLLFLRHVEEIEITVRADDGSLARTAHIKVSEGAQTVVRAGRARVAAALEEMRLQQNAISQNLVMEMAIDIDYAWSQSTRDTQNWLLATSIGDQASLNNCIPSHATAAALLSDGEVEGRAFCYLPLPLQTGFPVHIHAPWALSANRREILSAEDVSQNTLRAELAEWNRNLLLSDVPTAYCALLELLPGRLTPHVNATKRACSQQLPADGVDYNKEVGRWMPLPSAAVAPFDVSSVVCLRKAFESPIAWDGMCWRPLSQCVAATSSFSEGNYSHLTNVLRKADPPMAIVSLSPAVCRGLIDADCAIPETSPSLVAERLKTCNGQMTISTAMEALRYLLDTPNNPRLLIGLKLLPIVGPNGVTLHKALARESVSKQSRFYTVSDPRCLAMFDADFERIIDPSCPVYANLRSRACKECLNIDVLTAQLATGHLGSVVPLSWRGAGWVQVSANGHVRTAQALPSDLMAKPKKKSRRKAANRSEGARGEGASAVDAPIDTKVVLARISQWWEFAEQSKWTEAERNQLRDWPLVPLRSHTEDEPSTFLSLSFLDGLALCTHDFTEQQIQSLLSIGGVFVDAAPASSLHSLCRCNKRNALRALSQAQLHRAALNIGQEHANRVADARELVLSWLLEDTHGIDRDLGAVRSLPIFTTHAGGEWATASECARVASGWDELLAAADWKQAFLDSDGVAGVLLDAAEVPRPSLKAWLTGTVCDELNARGATAWSQKLCLSFLAAVAELPASPWGQKQDPKMKALIACLEQQPLVVLGTDERKLIGECIDPNDMLLSSLTGGHGVTALCPPLEYSQSSCVMKTMRKTGMLTLGDPAVFKDMARKVQANGDTDAGLRLVSFLIGAHRAGKLKWSSQDFADVSCLQFVPCVDHMAALTLKEWNESSEEHDTIPEEHLETQCRLEVKAGLTSFKEGCLARDAAVGFTQLPVFHEAVDSAASALLSQLRVLSPVPVDLMVSHLGELAARVGIAMQQKSTLHTVREGLLLCLDKLSAYLKAHKHSRNNVNFSLTSIPFIVFDDGSTGLASSLCVDIDEDLGPFSRVVPTPYAPHTKLLLNLGARHALQTHAPRVKVSLQDPSPSIVPFFEAQMNSPALSDLHCVVEGQVFYCHKLVLCAVCEPLKVEFVTSGLRAEGGISTIEMPDFVSYDAFECVMRYMYTGSIKHQGNNFEITQAAIVTVCSLLQLADYWALDHLKQWCESYLSSAQIVSLYNVCDLLLLAHQCDAPQLVQMCLHNIRVQFNLLKGTEQYEALPEDIKSEVLSEQAKCAADE